MIDINWFFGNCSIASFSIIDKFYRFLKLFANEINMEIIAMEKLFQKF